MKDVDNFEYIIKSCPTHIIKHNKMLKNIILRRKRMKLKNVEKENYRNLLNYEKLILVIWS